MSGDTLLGRHTVSKAAIYLPVDVEHNTIIDSFTRGELCGLYVSLHGISRAIIIFFLSLVDCLHGRSVLVIYYSSTR